MKWIISILVMSSLLFLVGCSVPECEYEEDIEMTISGEIIGNDSSYVHGNTGSSRKQWVIVETDQKCTLNILTYYSSVYGTPGTQEREDNLKDLTCLEQTSGFVTVTGYYKFVETADMNEGPKHYNFIPTQCQELI